MSALIFLVTFIILIVLYLVLVTLLYKPSAKKEGYTHPLMDDVSMQYNITNHPIRNQILNYYFETQTAPPAPKQEDIEAVRARLNDWYKKAVQSGRARPMDKWGKISIEAALDSISMGNWAIGNVICYMPVGTENDPTQWIEILRGGNRFFTRNPDDILSIQNYVPRLDSHAHGEMTVLDAFEDRLCKGYYDKTSSNYQFDASSPIDFRRRNDIVGYGMPDGIVLFTQLNSCQMCLSRIGNAGISRCYWLAPDTAGGLAHKLCDSVPAYFNMLNRQVHDVADVSPELIQFAFDAFAGPNAQWVTYCTWKLGQVGSPANLSADYKYCVGQFYANNKVGQNTVYDWGGFFRTIDMQGGPQLSCTVTPPK